MLQRVSVILSLHTLPGSVKSEWHGLSHSLIFCYEDILSDSRRWKKSKTWNSWYSLLPVVVCQKFPKNSIYINKYNLCNHCSRSIFVPPGEEIQSHWGEVALLTQHSKWREETELGLWLGWPHDPRVGPCSPQTTDLPMDWFTDSEMHCRGLPWVPCYLDDTERFSYTHKGGCMVERT